MSLLELDGVTWPGGPAGGLSLRLARGEARRMEVPAAAALGRRLMGDAPGSGKVLFNGEDLSPLPVWQRARRGLLLVSAFLPVLSGLTLPTLVRAGLAERCPQDDRARTLRAFLAQRCQARGLPQEALSMAWDEPPDLMTGWKLALLVADGLRPELPLFCPLDEAGAQGLSSWQGSSLILMERPLYV